MPATYLMDFTDDQFLELRDIFNKYDSVDSWAVQLDAKTSDCFFHLYDDDDHKLTTIKMNAVSHTLEQI